MKLTVTERLILANQYSILEILKPDEAKWYAYLRDALEDGYELGFQQVFDRFSDVLSAEDCKEVVDILAMHRALLFSYQNLTDKAGIEPGNVAFRGFDGNNETEQMGYCRYFCDNPSGARFPELGRPDDFNSHMEMLPHYRKMLSQWRQSADINRLSADDIKRITGV